MKLHFLDLNVFEVLKKFNSFTLCLHTRLHMVLHQV